jgi:hypothetical protein
MLKVQNENTLRVAINGQFNLFVGSGFSVLAQDRQGRSLPVRDQLRQELFDAFQLRQFDALSLAQVCTFLESQKRDALRSFLVERFSVASFDERYKILGRLPISAIFTTNIDNLVHRIYETSDTHCINDISITGPAFADKSAVDYIPLHGCVLYEEAALRFNTLVWCL